MVYSAEELLKAIDARLTASPRATLSRMAQELGVSRRTIERLLRTARSMSYRSYQQSVLLRIALERLQHDMSLTIKEIALSFDYSSSAAFARFIRSKTGTCPSRIRRLGNMRVP